MAKEDHSNPSFSVLIKLLCAALALGFVLWARDLAAALSGPLAELRARPDGSLLLELAPRLLGLAALVLAGVLFASFLLSTRRDTAWQALLRGLQTVLGLVLFLALLFQSLILTFLSS